jgi:hypothetical protein
MLVVLQLPFADLRPLVTSDTGRLSRPEWLAPVLGRDFVRRIGPVVPRRRGGVDPWPAEGVYCDARRALRFATSPRETMAFDAHGLRGPRCAFRRFLSDGEVVNRFELGFSEHLVIPADLEELKRVGRQVLDLEVGVRDGQPAVSLVRAGPRLARLLQECTTAQGATPAEVWWVAPGQPLLFYEGSFDEMHALPSPPPRVRNVEGVEVGHLLTQHAGSYARAWLVRFPSGVDKDLVRRLRIHLMRLHAHREGLKAVLRALSAGQLAASPEAVRLDDYLMDAAGFLARQSVYGLPQPDLLAQAYGYDDLVTPGEREGLLQQLRRSRAAASRRVQQALDQRQGDTPEPYYPLLP